MKHKKRTIFFIILGIVILWNMMFFPLWYMAYMNRSNRTFQSVVHHAKKSTLLQTKLGDINTVELHNFMKWISTENGKKCVEAIVKGEKKTKNVCIMIKEDEDDTLEPIKTVGYIIDGKEYLEQDGLEK